MIAVCEVAQCGTALLGDLVVHPPLDTNLLGGYDDLVHSLECVVVSFPDPQYVHVPCLESGNETRVYGSHNKIVVVFTHTLHTQNTHRAVIEVTSYQSSFSVSVSLGARLDRPITTS